MASHMPGEQTPPIDDDVSGAPACGGQRGDGDKGPHEGTSVIANESCGGETHSQVVRRDWCQEVFVEISFVVVLPTL